MCKMLGSTCGRRSERLFSKFLYQLGDLSKTSRQEPESRWVRSDVFWRIGKAESPYRSRHYLARLGLSFMYWSAVSFVTRTVGRVIFFSVGSVPLSISAAI